MADSEAGALETWRATVNAMQLGSALFAVTGTSEGTVECFSNGKMRTIKAIGPQLYADAGNWLLAFWLAVICREQRRMTELCEIPLERLRSPDDEYEEFYSKIRNPKPFVGQYTSNSPKGQGVLVFSGMYGQFKDPDGARRKMLGGAADAEGVRARRWCGVADARSAWRGSTPVTPTASPRS
ncbi:immunity 49 family protein [Streptomyces sp. KS 21]|uniref:immunity 49 family protein n=1 Tax=Streptomyces sp. KS 21 TaxID=2485150 RepID=UPI001FBBFE45|nr:immunity 49 family protein [Streptomyces sp. KS 21]